MTAAEPLSEESLDTLFSLPDSESRRKFLDQAGFLSAAGLYELLDRAMQYARADPSKARRLASICAEAAGAAGAPEIVPRALYVTAQTHAINGELTSALALIQEARSAYESLDDRMSALRTNLGKMHVLNEMGRHLEALEAGQETLELVEGQVDDPQAMMIAATVHMNEGVCYETLGRYDEALAAYDRAGVRFTELGMGDRLGDVQNNRGIVLVHLGRTRDALEDFQKALGVWEKENLTLLQAQTLSNIGEAHLALGNYTLSLNAYERSRSVFEQMDARADHSILLRKTADAYLALNLFPEAVSTYREAIELLEQAGMADHLARALWGLGTALAAQEEIHEAADCLNRAAALFKTAQNVPMLTSVNLERAALKEAQGDRYGAEKIAGAALEQVDPVQWPVEYLYANLRMADLLLPDADAAELFLQASAPIAERMPVPVIRYRHLSRLGRVRFLQGRDAEARKNLESALSEIESLRGNLAHESTRRSFLQDKTAIYDDLIRLHLRQGDEESSWLAFQVSESAKSRTLADLVAGVISSEAAGEADNGLMRSLSADLNAAYNQFYADPLPDQAQQRALQDRIEALEQAIGRERLRQAGRISGDPFETPLAPGDLRRELAGRGPLLSYHLLGDEILAFLLAKDQIRVFRNIGRVSVVQGQLQRLNAQWDRFRAGGEFVRRNLPVLEKSTRRVLGDLYSEIFALIDDKRGVAAPAHLAVVAHGILHQVPFHALFDGENYLLDRFAFRYAPSATVYILSQKRKRQATHRGVVAGLADDFIPAVSEEAHIVAGRLAESGITTELLTGDAVTRARLKTAAEFCDVMHFACHGLFRADNPMFSALKIADGWLTAADIAHFRLNGALVALSACESGRSRVLPGEEVMGLPRAFLGAGAAHVLVSLWLVQDETTAELMGDWYRRLAAGEERPAAIRGAQQQLKDRFPHPYYWAPFVLIG